MKTVFRVVGEIGILMKVYGPYLHNREQRRYVVVHRDDGTQKSMSYARWLMEQYLGRELLESETVDHKDDDRLNDSLDNLQILSMQENIRKSRVYAEMYTFDCPECGCKTEKPARTVRHNHKLGKKGPFCGRVCARAYQVRVAQLA